MAKMILGYWNLRGRGEIARMMFEYKGVDFEDKRYQLIEKPDGTIDASDWTDVKDTLDLAFPNVPYLIDGDVRLTESWAIYRYLGRKFNLYPTTDKGKYECDMIEGVTIDLLKVFGSVYSPDFKNQLAEIKEKMLGKICLVEKFLAGRQYVAGGNLTYADFALFEYLDWVRLLFPGIYDDLPNVGAYMERFESLERIAAFFESDRYNKFPIFAPMAAWSGKNYDDRDW